MAIASLVSSLLGWLCVIGPVLGLIFGFISLNQIKQSRTSGDGAFCFVPPIAGRSRTT